MSSKSCRSYCKEEKTPYVMGTGMDSLSDCCCNFNLIIILILIVLQFGKKEHGDCDGKKDSGQIIDNSILFIIAIYYLSCCLKCK